jgi:hypothetical protein
MTTIEPIRPQSRTRFDEGAAISRCQAQAVALYSGALAQFDDVLAQAADLEEAPAWWVRPLDQLRADERDCGAAAKELGDNGESVHSSTACRAKYRDSEQCLGKALCVLGNASFSRYEDHQSSTELGKLRVSVRIGHRLSVNWRSLIAPGLGLLDLRRKLEKQVLLAKPPHKLCANRQTRLRPRER